MEKYIGAGLVGMVILAGVFWSGWHYRDATLAQDNAIAQAKARATEQALAAQLKKQDEDYKTKLSKLSADSSASSARVRALLKEYAKRDSGVCKDTPAPAVSASSLAYAHLLTGLGETASNDAAAADRLTLLVQAWQDYYTSVVLPYTDHGQNP